MNPGTREQGAPQAGDELTEIILWSRQVNHEALEALKRGEMDYKTYCGGEAAFAALERKIASIRASLATLTPSEDRTEDTTPMLDELLHHIYESIADGEINVQSNSELVEAWSALTGEDPPESRRGAKGLPREICTCEHARNAHRDAAPYPCRVPRCNCGAYRVEPSEGSGAPLPEGEKCERCGGTGTERSVQGRHPRPTRQCRICCGTGKKPLPEQSHTEEGKR